jgi:hypothetical protein
MEKLTINHKNKKTENYVKKKRKEGTAITTVFYLYKSCFPNLI